MQDLLSEALLSFGASSTSVDEDNACSSSHEVGFLFLMDLYLLLDFECFTVFITLEILDRKC